jgi:hypothetical protein
LWGRSYYVSDSAGVETTFLHGEQVLHRVRTLTTRSGGIRYMSISGGPASSGIHQSPNWSYARESTAAYDDPVLIAQSEHRYPFPFMHHHFSFWNQAGFAFLDSGQQDEAEHGFRITGVTLPLWLPLVVFAAGPAVVLVKWGRRRLRVRGGRCRHCGYDLRATPGRCPECGAGAC